MKQKISLFMFSLQSALFLCMTFMSFSGVFAATSHPAVSPCHQAQKQEVSTSPHCSMCEQTLQVLQSDSSTFVAPIEEIPLFSFSIDTSFLLHTPLTSVSVLGTSYIPPPQVLWKTVMPDTTVILIV